MKVEAKDYYRVLGIQRGASREDIHKAYRTSAAKFHPDKHHGEAFFEERFREIKEAYETLFDNEKRWRYDVKKFGTSALLKKNVRREFESEEGVKGGRKFRIEIAHLEIYFSVFYFVNLAAGIVIKRVNDNALAGGYILGLFLCAVSTLFIWFLVKGIVDLIKQQYEGKRIYLGYYFLLTFGAGYVPLCTRWIP